MIFSISKLKILEAILSSFLIRNLSSELNDFCKFKNLDGIDSRTLSFKIKFNAFL